MERDGDDVIFSGSLFHDKGPAMTKSSANFVRYVGRASYGHGSDRKPGLHLARAE